MSEIRAFVSMAIHPDSLAEIQETVEVLVNDARNEQGVLELSYALDDSQSRVLVQERYADSSAMLAHLGNMNEKAVARLSDLVSIERMEIVGTTTPELRDALTGFGDVTYHSSLIGT